MRVTQQDIARIAKVSQATVSRVVAGDGRVEEPIRQRVVDVMNSLNYQPDVRARSLRKQQTQLVGLVMKREARDLQGDPFFSLFVSEILGYLSNTPYHLCVDIAPTDTRQEFVYDELLRSRRVDGLIIVEPKANDDRILRLQKDIFPFVIIGNPGDSGHIHSVDNDNIHAGEVATRHLIEQGYRRVGFIAGPEGIALSRDRVAGYQKVMQEIGQPSRVWHCEFGLDAARQTAIDALCSDDRPDALVVLDDYMAMGVVEAAREISLPIPSGLGIVGFNDTTICDLLPTGLTSVSLNIAQIAQIACGKLLRSIEGSDNGEVKRAIVECELKVRGSSRRTPEVSLR